MSTVLIDPSLRRARWVRLGAALFVALTVAVIAIFARGFRPIARRPPSLPTPRRAVTRPERRPESGRTRPEIRTARTASAASVPAAAPVEPVERAPLEVIAFVDPSARDSLVSLDRHATAIDEAATTGLLLGDDGALIDRMDPAVVDVARSHGLRLAALVQNLDESGESWRADRVRRLARSARARERLSAALVAASRSYGLAGVHLDLEQLDDGVWPLLARVVSALAPSLRAAGLEVSVDVPASLDAHLMARLAASVDRVVVMAYDEHDGDGDPGAIASDAFVDESLANASLVPTARRVAGFGIYGYDWTGAGVADPLSFVDAMASAK